MMIRRVWVLLAVAILSSAAAGALSQEEQPSVADTVRRLMEANLAAATAEDVDAYMATLHPDSPGAAATRQQMFQLLSTYDLSFRLLDFEFLGADAEYAVARTHHETRRLRGPVFRDNVVDGIQVFRLDGDEWRLWSTVVLEIKFAN